MNQTYLHLLSAECTLCIAQSPKVKQNLNSREPQSFLSLLNLFDESTCCGFILGRACWQHCCSLWWQWMLQPYSWESMDDSTANFTADITPLILAAHRLFSVAECHRSRGDIHVKKLFSWGSKLISAFFLCKMFDVLQLRAHSATPDISCHNQSNKKWRNSLPSGTTLRSWRCCWTVGQPFLYHTMWRWCLLRPWPILTWLQSVESN